MSQQFKIVICFWVLGFGLKAQINLVPNPSFELFTECPDTSSLGLSAANNWYSPTAYSPDYFNSCDASTMYSNGVPLNWYGHQLARTGNAYSGTIVEYGPGSNQREYIQTKLSDTLIVGKTYVVSFFVALPDSTPYAVNDMGAYLSTLPVSSINTNNLPCIPQIANDYLVNPLDIPDTWIEVTDTFVVDSSYQYITIGNFKDDASTDTTHIHDYSPTHENSSYHYIDDVSVICTDCSVGINDKFNRNQIKLFPNPASSVISVEFSNYLVDKIILFNSIGEVVATTIGEELKNRDSYQISVSHFPNGVYFIKIESKENFTTKSIIIKN